MERSRLVIAILLGALIAGALVFFLARSDRGPRGDKELQGLVDQFMKILPDTTTTEERDEIQGIMDRFYRSASAGNISADDVIEIEKKLREYVEKGEIPREELFNLMSRVGKATRRGAGGSG